MNNRIETDSMGEVEVSSNNLWGAQTQRSLSNFQISDRKFPIEFIYALIEIKLAAAKVNHSLKLIDDDIYQAISKACENILKGNYKDQFPLDIYQTGSGTQTNMNVNEVISNIAIQILGGEIGSKIPVHPNDHVNRSQSSNDVFPTAMHLSTLVKINNKLIPSIDKIINSLTTKQKEFWEIIKIGRTHLQDAVPITVGQEFSGYIAQLRMARSHIINTSEQLKNLAIGGTAVGTGLNAPHDFDRLVCAELSKLTGIEFSSKENKFALIASKDSLLSVSGSLRTLAVSLMKIANDIRWMASGPRAGLGELILPANEPGSSIMPGKINPTQNEMVIQVAAQVIGNDAAISIGAQMGYMELNLMKPVIISNLLESIEILSNAMNSFATRAIDGLEVNKKRIAEIIKSSLMLVTALTKHPDIGYDLAAKIAKKAHNTGKNIRDILIEDNILPADEIDASLDLVKMLNMDRMNE